MNKFQPVFEISLTPPDPALAAQPELGPRTGFQFHIKDIGELIHALFTQLDLLEHESDYSEDVPKLNLREEVRRFEINLIQRALTHTHGRQVEAARVLGLKATTLNAKMKRYRLHRPYMIPFAPAELNQPNTRTCEGT